MTGTEVILQRKEDQEGPVWVTHGRTLVVLGQKFPAPQGSVRVYVCMCVRDRPPPFALLAFCL